MTRVLAALGLLFLGLVAAATVYGIAMYRELQKPASWMRP